MTSAAAQQVDLTQCEREPVHIPGAIQPFGCLVAFALPAWTIAHVSLNASAVFGFEEAEAMIGKPAESILTPKIIHDLRNTFQAAMISGFDERLPLVDIGPAGVCHDVLVHASSGFAIAEFLPCEGAEAVRSDPTTLVKTIIDRLRRTTTFQSFLTSAARQIRAVTGFDRVMIYRFLADDSGEVVAEAVRAGMTPFMGLHYPASDIPPQSRALFERQWLRMIPAVDYGPVAIVPTLTTKGLPLDLSLSTLRSASPVHLEYLRNMGVTATLTVSILRGGRLWGLIACHHETPRRISTATAAAVELFAQVFSTQIEAKQQHDELAYIAHAREAHDRLIADMAPEETIFENLSRFDEQLRALIPADGIGIWTDGRFESSGIAPPAEAVEDLVRFLNTQPVDRVFHTNELKRHLPDAVRYADKVAGVLSIPFSRAPKDFLLLFRREVLQTVTWGGDPNKPAAADASGRIGPRNSFAAWKQIVSGQSMPWLRGEADIAETLRVSLLDIILRRANLVDRERRVAQESQLLLVAELNHRVKNILAVIRSLVGQSRFGAASVETFVSDLQQRLHALSVAHDQLTQSHWKAAPLAALIEAEAKAWTTAEDRRLVLDGPPVMIEARAYQTLALVLHEMMTNAAKYGALSVDDARLAISWALDPERGLILDWTESGGPSVVPPSRRGFGTVVVEQSIPFELKGTARIEHAADGVKAQFTIPTEFVLAGDATAAPRRDLPVARADLQGKNLLLVEDSMMIALDAQAMLQNCGAEVELAATTADARRALSLNTFDAAILDVNLYTETSFAIAEDLQDREIPFVFATGYGETIVVPERFKSVFVVSKPYVEDVLRAALAA
ncbi:hypothetical protein RHAL1_00657 [Beijerinckiaceae bacterium RH AL1]|nr:hypothetical protein RHAL8_00626 [Beijerinckiaceae bacterium RH AL8]VVB43321.1 hypothetical protein RHCH11_RHCH11_00628 [Beijerinckiaceae bacterium RH CH11]VVC53774.1 hypothetical protein RHAL1_00657 [Beijerinckiaceae bacterium RH AL1]